MEYLNTQTIGYLVTGVSTFFIGVGATIKFIGGKNGGNGNDNNTTAKHPQKDCVDKADCRDYRQDLKDFMKVQFDSGSQRMQALEVGQKETNDCLKELLGRRRDDREEHKQ